MAGNPESKQPSPSLGCMPEELAAKQKISRAVEFVASRRVCENAAFLINEYLGDSFAGYTLEKLKGSVPEAKKLAPKEWLKVDSVIRLRRNDGKLLEMVIMELRDWGYSSHDDSESGGFFIRYGGELVFESTCVRSVINEAYQRAISIYCQESFVESFSNGDWVNLLSEAALEGQKLKQRWKDDAKKEETEKLIGRAGKMKL